MDGRMDGWMDGYMMAELTRALSFSNAWMDGGGEPWMEGENGPFHGCTWALGILVWNVRSCLDESCKGAVSCLASALSSQSISNGADGRLHENMHAQRTPESLPFGWTRSFAVRTEAALMGRFAGAPAQRRHAGGRRTSPHSFRTVWRSRRGRRRRGQPEGYKK
jgi:hypothetical protein